MLKTVAQKLDPQQDAIDLLKKDHREVEALFKQFKAADDKRSKRALARRICTELDIHAKIEEKFFYRIAKRDAPESADTVNEGIVEHEGVKRLVKQLSTMDASDELFDARMTVLEEYVKHHVKEEETSMFPKIVEGDVDLKALGQTLAQARRKLQSGATSSRSRSNGARSAGREARA